MDAVQSNSAPGDIANSAAPTEHVGALEAPVDGGVSRKKGRYAALELEQGKFQDSLPTQKTGRYAALEPVQESSKTSLQMQKKVRYAGLEPVKESSESAVPTKKGRYAALELQQSSISTLPTKKGRYTALELHESSKSALPAKKGRYAALELVHSNPEAMPPRPKKGRYAALDSVKDTPEIIKKEARYAALEPVLPLDAELQTQTGGSTATPPIPLAGNPPISPRSDEPMPNATAIRLPAAGGSSGPEFLPQALAGPRSYVRNVLAREPWFQHYFTRDLEKLDVNYTPRPRTTRYRTPSSLPIAEPSSAITKSLQDLIFNDLKKKPIEVFDPPPEARHVEVRLPQEVYNVTLESRDLDRTNFPMDSLICNSGAMIPTRHGFTEENLYLVFHDATPIPFDQEGFMNNTEIMIEGRINQMGMEAHEEMIFQNLVAHSTLAHDHITELIDKL
ncbi:hypothetical protein CPC08DRAFT_730010 [Agrocybe pediades]|nr:hypothetical protein CPC08DRAFT_730010 [Agrocybe pediades]